MTYKEKLKQDHPGWDRYKIESIVGSSCPNEYGYLDDSFDCSIGCIPCWDREIPETHIVPNHKNMPIDYIEPTIKDSGDRTRFETGAVRDMREGKGRFDVMPVEVIRDYLNDEIIGYLANFQQDHDTAELYTAIDCFAMEAFGCKYTMLLEVAKHFEEGAKKYGPENYKKGIPVWCYIDSAVRHYIKWRRGDTDEPHDRAFCWNLLCCIWEVDYHDKNEED